MIYFIKEDFEIDSSNEVVKGENLVSSVEDKEECCLDKTNVYML